MHACISALCLFLDVESIKSSYGASILEKAALKYVLNSSTLFVVLYACLHITMSKYVLCNWLISTNRKGLLVLLKTESKY